MSGKGWIIVCGGRGETQFVSSDSRIDRELCWLWNAELCPNYRAHMAWIRFRNDPDLRIGASIRNIRTYTWSFDKNQSLVGADRAAASQQP